MGQQIRHVMKNSDAGVVPVTENGSLISMVTDRDTATRVVADDKDTGAGKVGDVPSAAAS
jgi:CBS domain-containing protein